MSIGNIRWGRAEYRKGLILGLTMAEVVLLIIFSLLLALTTLLLVKEKTINKQAEKLAAFERIIDTLESKDFEAAVKELVLLTEERALIERLLAELDGPEALPKKIEALVKRIKKAEPAVEAIEALGLNTEAPEFADKLEQLGDLSEKLEQAESKLRAMKKLVEQLKDSLGTPKGCPWSTTPYSAKN